MEGIAGKNRVVFADRHFTWRELSGDANGRLGNLDQLRKHRLMFAVSDEFEALSAVSAGIFAKLDFGVAEKTMLNDDLRRRLAEQGVRIVDLQNPQMPPDANSQLQVEPGRISVLTSGTTGLPKLVPHTAESLNTFDRVRQLDSNRWFLPYQIGSYAWYQMVSLSICVGGQDLVPGKCTDLMNSFEDALFCGRVTAISSTPTFWRHALITIDAQKLNGSELKAITLGGEIVDQAILDQLRNLFPKASIRHIYASSEAGAAVVVSDGRAGFDAALLDVSEESPISVRVVDGRLFVRSRYGNTDDQGDWIDTGDLVERRGDRMLFCGRADNQMINVGGQKAYPALIEARLLAHPDVVWAHVVARRAPLMGCLPMANVVLKPDVDPLEAERKLTKFCEAQLAEHAVPRIWNFLDEVPLRASLKS